MAPPVAGYTAWYDATQMTALADGASVSSWTDESANGYNATATGTQQPTFYKTTTAKLINGNPTVSFSGSNYMLATSVPNIPATATVFCVIKSAAINGAYTAMLSTNSANEYLSVLITSSPSKWEIYDGALFTAGTADTSAHVVMGLFNGASSQISIDGSSIGTGNAGSNASGAVGLVIGALSTGSSYTDYWQGLIGEIIVYSSALSTSDQSSTNSYLINKWLGGPSYAPPAYAPHFVPIQRASLW